MIPNIIPMKQTSFSLTPLLCDSAYNKAQDDTVITLISPNQWWIRTKTTILRVR